MFAPNTSTTFTNGMNKQTDNRFLIRRNYFKQNLSINDFVFGGCVTEKLVSSDELLSEVRNLTSALGFNVHLSGYNYLTRLTAIYLVKDDYDEADAISMVSDYYRISVSSAVSNIVEIISENTEFLPTASYLLNTAISAEDCVYIRDAVEIIAALFKIYYNYIVEDGGDLTSEYNKAINFYRSFKNAN